jgi:MFS family permease
VTFDARGVLAAQAARAFGYGLGAVLLGSMLHQRRYSSTEAGAVLASVLCGKILESLVVGRWGVSIGRRRRYAALYGVLAVTGLVFAFAESVWPLVIVSLAGGLSTEVVESGPFTSLEQAMLAGQMQRADLARGFGVYNAVATAAGSVGALAAAGIGVLRRSWSHAPADARFFVLLVPAALAGMVIASRLTASVETPPTTATSIRSAAPSMLGASRPVVIRLAALFAVDSFGGGFVVQAFIAFWLGQRFDASLGVLGITFFAVGVLQTVSFLVAGRLADRFGLLVTMVFTHLPSNLLLIAMAFAPNLTTAIILLLLRVVLSQMDVPTRQAYVMALVDPAERTAAASVTNTARYLVRPIGPLLAGTVQTVGLGAPFVLAGTIKSTYDLVLWRWFRTVPLPEAVPA